MDTKTDTELMVAVRGGDVARLAELFDRHHVRLFNFVLRLTGRRDVSEDLVQESFLRMLKYRASYRADASFAVWMYTIARNVLADHWRRSAPGESLERAESVVDTRSSPFEELRVDEEVAALRAAMGMLPEDRRELLVLVRFEGLSYEELSGLLGCSVGAVKVRVHRALTELRQAYAVLTGGDHDVRRAESTID